LNLSDELKEAVDIAAQFHDHGKCRRQFQYFLGNFGYPQASPIAKSGKKGGRLAETYRHEFGSLIDVQKEEAFNRLPDEMKHLVLHVIAVHHGRARPNFPPEEAFDPERPQPEADDMASVVPRRFARLQRKYGRWGLAYLESLLRAADWAASANPSKFVEDEQ
jgi:CRISPR-associated endonuclease/helicase Cas3